MKSGIVIPAGTPGELSYIKNVYAQFDYYGGGAFEMQSVGISLMKAGDKFKGMKNVPSIAALSRKMEDDCCVCGTVTGARVEPDGEDEYGFPSHLKMLGMI